MGAQVGTSAVTKFYVGSTVADRVYLGADLIWQNASISASPNPANDVDFVAEPAPNTRAMQSSTTLSGTGLTSATWAQISGSTDITVTPGTNGMSAVFDSTQIKSSGGMDAVFRATGNHGLVVDVSVHHRYDTDV